MSRLTIYPESSPAMVLLRTEDPDTIAGALREIGVRFERWADIAPPPPDADSETILGAYRPHLDALIGGGAGTADVIQLRPNADTYPAMRAKFLSEHIHTEDEVRFFVHGSGNFILHVDGKVFDAHCAAGDLISVPEGIKHWFDAGEQPNATVLRIFTDTTGWTPHYTGDAIAERFPAA